MNNRQFYQRSLEQYLAASDSFDEWDTKRVEYIMSGKAGKARFIERKILPDLKKIEKACLQKLIDMLAEHGYYG